MFNRSEYLQLQENNAVAGSILRPMTRYRPEKVLSGSTVPNVRGEDGSWK
jgi:hypothetical protein